MNLTELGWNSFFDNQFAQYQQQGFKPARVSEEHRNLFVVISEDGELSAEVTGKFRFSTTSRGQFPAVGDWVAISERQGEGKAIIHALLNRKSGFERKVSGETTVEQVVAANIDTAFIVNGLDHDFNIRRLERYLTLAWESGASPVVLLNKIDLCENFVERIVEVGATAIGVPIHAISAKENAGLEILNSYLRPGVTTAFLGSSGAGKSSIINCLLGEERLLTNEVRDWDSRGRHTTTWRQLIVLPAGGIVIDTPGMRMLKLWGDEDGLKKAFTDIEELAASCKFRDCSHETEPGCAIMAAIENGELAADRYESYRKLKREQRYLEARQIMKANAVEKLRWRQIAMLQKKLKSRNQ